MEINPKTKIEQRILAVIITSVFLTAIYFAAIPEKKTVPAWVNQEIDKESSCEIIPCVGITIITFGNGSSFAAVYKDDNCTMCSQLYKSNKAVTNLDFDYNREATQFYSDSCRLKEDLRHFIKIKIAEYKAVNKSTQKP